MKNGKQRYVVLAVLFLAWTVGYLDRTAINLGAIPIAKDLGLSTTQTGFMMSIFFLSYAFMQLFGGYLADKIGSRIVLIFSIAMWSLFTGLTGMAASFISLAVTRFFFGFGEGSFPSASSVTIADWFKKEERGRAKSVILTGSTLGGLIGTAAAGFMITSFGWRSMFFILGILGVVVTILFIIFVKSPEDAKVKKQAQKTEKGNFITALKSPIIIPVLGAWFFWSISLWGFTSWMPSYWVKARNLDLINSGLVSALPALLGIFGMLFSGWMVDKVMKGREKFWGMLGASVMLVCLIFMFNATSTGMAIFFNSIAGFFMTFMSPVVFAFPLKYVPEKIVGSSTGIINFGGMLAAFFSPTIIGMILNKTSDNFNYVLYFFIACIALSIVFSSFMPQSKKEVSGINASHTS